MIPAPRKKRLGFEVATLFTTKAIILFSMILLGLVSMWTTYISLRDSILPEPLVTLPLGENGWKCSIFALFLSVAIGLMLFALKLAIIGEQKRLNFFGLAGLIIVGFISICFNMDVLYRTADRHFFLSFNANKVRGVYEPFLAEVQVKLITKRDALLKTVASQEGELQAEIEGLRNQPAGYGAFAKQESYRLTLLKKTVEVDLKSVMDALEAKKQADQILHGTDIRSLDDILKLQNELRNVAKDPGVVAGMSLPQAVDIDSPFFAVFAKLFDLKNVGLKEVFFLLIAIFLDVGDIIGYCLVPNKKKAPQEQTTHPAAKDLSTKEMPTSNPTEPSPRFLSAEVARSKFIAYLEKIGFEWNEQQKQFEFHDGTVVKRLEGIFEWELIKTDGATPVWIAPCGLEEGGTFEIPAKVWNMAKAGEAMLFEPKGDEFVERKCAEYQEDVQAGRIEMLAIYRIRPKPLQLSR